MKWFESLPAWAQMTVFVVGTLVLILALSGAYWTVMA